MVEFALVMSAMIVVLVVGLAGYALYLGNYLTLKDALSVSARQVAISAGLTGVDPCGIAKTAVTAAYQAGAFESVAPTMTPTVTIYPPPGGLGTTVTNSTGTCSGYLTNLVPGATVEVSVSHATQSLFGSYGGFTINGQAESIVQGVE